VIVDSTDEPSHALLGKKLGPYLIERLLGEGGMGAVFAATVRRPVHGLSRGDRVAVKTIHEHMLENDSAVQRFEREGQLGIDIDHPNVVRTYEVGTRRMGLRKVHLLVMEYVEGQTLQELLDELRCVPEELCRHIGREIAQGLAAVHAVGAVHRDIVAVWQEHQSQIGDRRPA
jgi:serine/threonine protein kinase